jgi:hypothetical protein
MVVQRAKSILAADSSFFSATSSNQRIRGQELHERLMRVLCETMLQPSADSCLTMTQAYKYFCRLAELRQLGTLKRSMFKASMTDLMRDRFGICLRRDVPNAIGKHQEAWKGASSSSRLVSDGGKGGDGFSGYLAGESDRSRAGISFINSNQTLG